ncbi:sodium/potassium/calcium exchanger 3-like isoform X2 [Dendronephthya gigantea]|uniref:sodium/potassium/calcium exchanger 3-like isoform X2 n=1 Tax=Dendronephthya gigantea TaxID=151771 RepID=UPI00106D3023|nr:sodium/potassium/calcium exchanger 3-like isoform X2 [Dendronephthya gigantea]
MAVFTKKIKYIVLYISLFCGFYTVKDFLQISTTNMNGFNLEIRHKSSQNIETSTSSVRHLLSHPTKPKCTPPAILEFPRDLLNRKQRLYGGILLHVLVAFYMFWAITIICDDYFVPALDVICERCNLQSDVAGATFMALGSSAPELFASVIGVFITKGDIGTGTILGSAVFNVLFVIGVCALFSGHVLKLSWWPIVRDLMSYLLALIILVLVIMDGVVKWYEAITMMCSYSLYLILMYFNPSIERFVYRITNTEKAIQFPEHHLGYTGLAPARDDGTDELCPGHHYKHDGDQEDSEENKKQRDNECCLQDMEFDAALGNPFHPPSGKCQKLCWCLALPLNICFYFTIPDVRKPKCKKWYPLSFFVCIIWIAVTSYILVWMVTLVGYTFGVPDTIMGLTLVAFGSSVPDCISSLVVAKKGDGDMACSHTVGSNVFDILLCLGLPWTLKTMIFESKSSIVLNSHGLYICCFFIMASILLTFLMMHFHEWTLTKTVGCTYLVVYLIFISIACVIELNVFGYVNPPMCKVEGGY